MFKGLTLSFFIILMLLTVVPLGITFAMVGPEQYGKYCKMAIHMPCLGMGDQMYYVMNLKTGTIIDIYDSLGEAIELVDSHPTWTIMIRYNDRKKI